ncbi:MAG TPA: DNA-binding protein WhiA [Bacillota bacterium]|jgi:DNA-binding protein WhiA|nr:DNA-binding protein WhiA [Bacillota bacterium]
MTSHLHAVRLLPAAGAKGESGIMGGFSKRTKDELARVMPKHRCCRRAELAGLLHGAGSLHLSQRGFAVTAAFENAAVVRKALKLLKAEFQYAPQIVAEQTRRLRQRRRYLLILDNPGDAEGILRELGIMNRGFVLEGGISPELVKDECCRAAFLRGVFLARGSITDPQKKSYHLEFVTENEDFASGLCYLMNLCKFKARMGKRKTSFVVYLKDVEMIARFLTFISAHAALLQLEEIRVLKGMREEINRLVNCDTANLEKTVSAAMSQIDLISKLIDSGGLERLPESLREVAMLRLEHPEASLKELGELAVPRMSKSAINHRMRRLREWVKKYAEEEGIIPDWAN